MARTSTYTDNFSSDNFTPNGTSSMILGWWTGSAKTGSYSVSGGILTLTRSSGTFTAIPYGIYINALASTDHYVKAKFVDITSQRIVLRVNSNDGFNKMYHLAFRGPDNNDVFVNVYNESATPSSSTEYNFSTYDYTPADNDIFAIEITTNGSGNVEIAVYSSAVSGGATPIFTHTDSTVKITTGSYAGVGGTSATDKFDDFEVGTLGAAPPATTLILRSLMGVGL